MFIQDGVTVSPVVKHHAKERHEDMKVKLHIFYTSVPDGEEQSGLASLIPGERLLIP
jgi:hypothetical protein